METQEISIESLVYQALGEASMCWSETPKGIFDSDRVKIIGDNLIKKLRGVCQHIYCGEGVNPIRCKCTICGHEILM